MPTNIHKINQNKRRINCCHVKNDNIIHFYWITMSHYDTSGCPSQLISQPAWGYAIIRWDVLYLLFIFVNKYLTSLRKQSRIKCKHNLKNIIRPISSVKFSFNRKPVLRAMVWVWKDLCSFQSSHELSLKL